MRSLIFRDPFEEFNKSFDMAFRNSDTSVNVERCQDSRKIYIDLPGVKKQDVKITIDRGSLVVEAERKGFLAKSYKNSFVLPRDLDSSKAEFDLTDGVLTVSIPLLESSKPKTIFLT
jgi:HSP20 family protein